VDTLAHYVAQIESVVPIVRESWNGLFPLPICIHTIV
jgi:hypothetical protein